MATTHPKAKSVPAKEQTTALGYLRVSKMGTRSVDDDSTQTLKIQRKRIEARAADRGWKIVGWYTDLDCSGGDTDRPQFQQALAAIGGGRGGADVFCCAFLDRFSRNLVDCIETEKQIRQQGGSLVVCDTDIDTSTPNGRMVFQILASVNEQFLAVKTDQFNEHRASAIARRIAPHRTPLGYQKGPDRVYQIVESEAEIVRLAYQLRADGVSCPDIARQLNDRGYTSRAGARYSDKLVRNLLAVKSYCGDLVDGDYEYRDAHPPIVSRDVWQRAQTERRPRALESTPSLLAGTVRCATCSHSMIVQGDRRVGNLYYRCRRRHAAGDCAAPASIRMENLDAYVESQFLATVDRLPTLAGIEAAGDADVEQAIADAQLELDTFVGGASITALGVDLYNAQVAKRRAALDAALDARRRSQRASLPHVGFRAVADVWPDLSIPEKREVLKATLDAVFVTPGDRAHASADPATRTYVAPRGTIAVDLPRSGVIGTLARFDFPVDGAPDVAGVLAA